MAPHEERTYRNIISGAGLDFFRVVVQETDLAVHAPSNMGKQARESVLKHRGYIETYIRQHPEFAGSLEPWNPGGPVPGIINRMVSAGNSAGVGPMAAVAGAIAEGVGNDLLNVTHEVIVENGGDIFLKTDTQLLVGLFAGKSSLSMRIALRIDSSKGPVGVCTSSGRIGHSLSLGTADAVCVVSNSCPLADAAATSIGNRIHSKKDIKKALSYAKTISGVKGVVIVAYEEIGLWGNLEIVPMQEKGVEF
jgi:uncharacterized protein